jgi:hypothetical protein
MVISQPDNIQSFLVLKYHRKNVLGKEISTPKGTNVQDMLLPRFKIPLF